MSNNCPHLENVAAFLAEEFSREEQAEFELHLAGCADCQAAAASLDRVLGRLRSLPAAPSPRDLAPLVLAAVRQPERPLFQRYWRPAAAVAAGLALLGSLVSKEMRHHEPAATPLALDAAPARNEQALDWLVRAQEADGSWGAERWGGQRNYAPALTALPLLALATAPDRSAERDAAAAHAVANLLALQTAEGGFGHDFYGAPYNSSIATFALLNASRKYPGLVPKAALDAAVSDLMKRQLPDGGWGFLDGESANSAITEWHIQALELATSLGWEAARPALERGLQKLAVKDETQGSATTLLAQAAPRVSSTTGALDFYRVYFAAAALKRENTPAAQRRLASLRRELLRHQVTGGAETGSWAPDDQWGIAGGRLYSTALASLTLENR